MKRFIFGGISTVILAGVGVPFAMAQSGGDVTCPGASAGMQGVGSPMPMGNVRDTEAFNLVSLAYRGEFEAAGVPSYSQLVMEYTTGDLSAEDVVAAGVEAGYLSPAALEDDDYLNAVELQLEAFGFDDA